MIILLTFLSIRLDITSNLLEALAFYFVVMKMWCYFGTGIMLWHLLSFTIVQYEQKTYFCLLDLVLILSFCRNDMKKKMWSIDQTSVTARRSLFSLSACTSWWDFAQEHVIIPLHYKHSLVNQFPKDDLNLIEVILDKASIRPHNIVLTRYEKHVACPHEVLDTGTVRYSSYLGCVWHLSAYRTRGLFFASRVFPPEPHYLDSC